MTNLFEFYLEDFERLYKNVYEGKYGVDKKVKMVVVNSPHNPTGWSIFPEARRFYNAITDPDTVVFSDEMYARILTDVAGDGGETSAKGRRVFSSLLGYSKNTIVLSGLSKPQGMPGLRSGWLLVDKRNPALFERLCVQKDYVTICGSAPSEILAIAGLRLQDRKLLPRNRLITLKNMMLLRQVLGDQHTAPDGAGRPTNAMEVTTPAIVATSSPASVHAAVPAAPPGWLRCPFFPLKTYEHAPVEPMCTLFVALGDKALRRFGSAQSFSQTLIDRWGICLVPSECFWEQSDMVAGVVDHTPAVRFGLGRKNFGEALKALVAALWVLEGEGGF